MLSGPVTNTGSGHIDATGAGSNVRQNGVTVTGGTINTSGGGVFVPANNGNNFLSGVTLNGTIDMATATGIERVLGTLTLTTGSNINVNNNSILNFEGSTALAGTGTITLGATGANNRIGIDNTGTLTVGANILIHGQNGTIGGAPFVGGASTLNNGGTISADVSGGLINVVANSTTNSAGGVLQAANGGTLQLNNTVSNQGLVEALANSAVTYVNGSTTTNNVAGTLTGGIWRANSVGGSSATVTLRGSNITTNAADVYLVGANSLIQVATTSIDTTLSTNNGSLRIHEGRVFNAIANSGNFTNNGLLELASGTATAVFQATTSLTNTGTILGYGTVNNRPTNTGTITASLGTLSITGGISGPSGTVESNSGATLNLSSAVTSSTAGTLRNDGALNLGTQNITVSSAYTNANFGVGNSFNNRANVSGTGQILAAGANPATAQTLSGNIAPTPTTR